MDVQRIQQLILSVLKTDERLWNDEKTELNQTLLLDLVSGIDEVVIGLLLQDDVLKEKFFVKIHDSYVFKSNDFMFFMEENKVNNSYTQYKNRIGLTDGRRFLKDSNDVVLDFPYKDCVLEGGQSTEEGTDTYFEYEEEKKKTKNGETIVEPAGYKEKESKRKEIFFNQTLAHDEIDRLFDDKALVNWKRYSKDGEQAVVNIARDENGTIKENLVIKGNNLLALHSLKKQFTGKVKLIYIDPPYNTGSDDFNYNDNFNHSTWLTFMKNRLEIAKKSLLKSDGIVLVQCSFHEYAYLKVLMDEMFEKYLCTFNIQVRHPDRNLTGDKEYNDVIEYILIYAKDPSVKMPTILEKKTVDDYIYKIEIIDEGKKETITCGKKQVDIFKPDNYTVTKEEPSKLQFKTISVRGSIREKNSSGRFYVQYLESLKDLYPSETLFRVPDMGDDISPYRFFYSPPEGNKNGGYYQGMPQSSDVTKKQYPNYFNFEKEYNTASKQGGVELRNGKKPEELLKFLISVFSGKGDLILDYHSGSGTTSAVAHKLERRWITIEQLDSQLDISLQRFQNVVNGDQTGVSKEVKWEGGGSFIYCELAKSNEQAKESILASENLEELLKLFDSLYVKYFLNYNLKIKDFKEVVINEEEFKELSLNEQKNMFLAMLDLNQMYIQKSEMSDKKYLISKEDQRVTDDFYNGDY